MYGYSQAGVGGGGAEEAEQQATALLQHMDKPQLNDLLENDAKVEELTRDLQKVRQVESEREDLVIQNKSLAEYNLSLKPRLDELKTDVARSYEEVHKMKMSLAEDKAKLDIHCSTQKMETMLALLQTQSAEAEEESEELANAFMKKEMNVDSFLSSFLERRMTAHLRKVRAEKLAELIRQGGTGLVGPLHPPHHHQNSWPSYSNGPPAQGPALPSYGGGSLPYPTGPGFPMPQPAFPYRH